MKIGVVLYGALLAAAVIFAEEEPSNDKKTIALGEVQPIPQPKAKTISDEAAVKFKPQIHVSDGCQSYPAVNAAGKTTAGLTIDEITDEKCKGSKSGSQIYGRPTWHRGKWAIMFAWNFPLYSMVIERSDWEHVVLWLNNPAVANQTLEAVSVWDESKRMYTKAVPPERKYMDGSSVKLDIKTSGLFRILSLTALAGQSQPLILWDQMSDHIQSALTTANWGTRKPMPLSESRFTLALENAWPFAPVAPPPAQEF